MEVDDEWKWGRSDGRWGWWENAIAVTERDERCMATAKDEGLGDRSEVTDVDIEDEDDDIEDDDIEDEEEDMIIAMTLVPPSSFPVAHLTSFLVNSWSVRTVLVGSCINSKRLWFDPVFMVFWRLCGLAAHAAATCNVY